MTGMLLSWLYAGRNGGGGDDEYHRGLGIGILVAIKVDSKSKGSKPATLTFLDSVVSGTGLYSLINNDEKKKRFVLGIRCSSLFVSFLYAFVSYIIHVVQPVRATPNSRKRNLVRR